MRFTGIARVFAVCAALLWSAAAGAAWHQRDDAIMGTSIHVELWHENATQAERLIDAVMAEMRHVDRMMSPYIATSELYRINEHAAMSPQVVSKELFDLLGRSIAISELSGGVFDITYASVGYLYDYRERKKPSSEQIASLLPAINYRWIKLDEAQHSVFFTHANVRIDLGGIAKGHAVDRCIELLQRAGVQHALVSAGGDTRMLGDRRGRPWMVGIRHPRDRNRNAVMLPLENVAISTSGDYERFFEENGTRYHHILSPRTGRSAHVVQSVSIIGPSATMTDGLTKIIFIDGIGNGMPVIESVEGYDAIVIDNDHRVHYSKGLQQATPASSPVP
jgi:thiamine biosynthesis lipoprotein